MDMLNQVVNFTVGLSSVLELPGKILSIIAVPFAIVAYLSGRRRRLIDLSGESANEELLKEVRQGFQTLAAAIAALSAGRSRVLERRRWRRTLLLLPRRRLRLQSRHPRSPHPRYLPC